ncbi:MAG: fumarylacetoacetate hydrolase family protein [Candidatus Hydrogenedentes bacterium]|nr:fumarylacetoacetate hydrolase family protein [Candidatus Hydrogenedentota bacterium]
MKFVRFTTARHPQGVYGLAHDNGDIEVLKGGLFDAPEPAGETVSPGDIQRYLVPVDPPNILAVGRNYREHAAETDDDLPQAPLLFIKATTSLAAHEDDIVIPAAAPGQVDYEAELVAIIGRTARNVPIETALDYVFGFSCGHDVSARDCQQSDGQWARAKSFDTFAPMGPFVVTGIDVSGLRIRMRVNDECVQDQSTKDMVFNVPYLVSYLSRSTTLLPGTALFTGTPCGVGIARTPPLLLKPGDVCEVDIEGVGVLRNRVVAETQTGAGR